MQDQRIQLTLFVEEYASKQIEQIRREYNPKQYALIKSHVTLCRENELEQIESILQKLENLQQDCITIEFGSATRFSNNQGVLLPAKGDNEPFHALRAMVLQNILPHPSRHQPHITLMHPRNAACTHEQFEAIKKIPLPNKLTFHKISLIQQEAGKEWVVLREFILKKVR